MIAEYLARPLATRSSRYHSRRANRGQGQLAGYYLGRGGYFRRGPPDHAGCSASPACQSVPGVSGGQRVEYRGTAARRRTFVRRAARRPPAARWYRGRPRTFRPAPMRSASTLAWARRGARLGVLADNAADEPQLGEPTDVTIRSRCRLAPGQHDRGPRCRRDGGRCRPVGLDHTSEISTPDPSSISYSACSISTSGNCWVHPLAVPRKLGNGAGAGRDLGSAIDRCKMYAIAWRTSSSPVSQMITRPPRQVDAGGSRACAAISIFRSSDVPAAPPHRRLARVPRLHRSATFRRCSCALCCLLKTQAFTGIAASTCANYPPRCSPTGRAAARAERVDNHPAAGQEPVPSLRDKQLGRKLQELAITFLLESALGKDRILEIYLNIIEWGPDPYLQCPRPAAISVANRES